VSKTVIFDTNIWISFSIGESLAHLEKIFTSKSLVIFTCHKTLTEYLDVVNRPKIKKYLSDQRIEQTLSLMQTFTPFYEAEGTVNVSRDPKDNYLLAAAKELKADYLETGDQDLLVLHPFE
jgi:putative PIN family toxin of toxin-antitoxin system